MHEHVLGVHELFWTYMRYESLKPLAIFAKCSMLSGSEEAYFFLSEFSFTVTDNSQDGRGREKTIFYSTLPLPPAHGHSEIYLQPCMWDGYHIFLMATLVFTRLLLDEIYHLIELLFDWLIVILIFVYLLELILGFVSATWHEKPVDSNSHRLSFLNYKRTD